MRLVKMAAPFKRCLWLKYFPKSAKLSKYSFTTSKFRTVTTSSFDPGPVFFRDDVQKILKRITGLDIDRIFKFRPVKDHHEPSYELLTQSQLQERDAETLARANALLQMPPYLKINSEPEDVVSDDPEIEGHDTHNIVFTDITYNILHKERSIVVREPGGKLRSANYAERNRVMLVYFPQEGKMMHKPEMFEEENLERLLNQHKYEYLLDRSCVQFEPDEADYVKISHRTYEHVNSASRYDDLRSTRHFGPMSFYLAHYQKMEGLLVDMIQNNLLSDAADMVDLYHIIHPEAKSVQHVKREDSAEDKIQAYLTHTSRNPGVVELALQTYKDSIRHKKSNIV